MTINTVTHRRLVRQFAALGPYLRELQSTETQYFFDSLSVCVSAKPEPELREFWGWWLFLTTQDGQHFEFHYHLGLYEADGHWVEKPIPKTHQAEVTRTLRDFYDKLDGCLSELSLSMRSATSLGTDHLLSSV